VRKLNLRLSAFGEDQDQKRPLIDLSSSAKVLG